MWTERPRRLTGTRTAQHSKAKCLSGAGPDFVLSAASRLMSSCRAPKGSWDGPSGDRTVFPDSDAYSTHFGLKMKNVSFY